MSSTNTSHLGRAIARWALGFAWLLVTRSASSQATPSGSAQPPAASPPAPPAAPPGSAPPPYMYQENWTPPPGSQPANPSPQTGRPAAVAPNYGPLPPPYPPPPYPGPALYEPPPPPATYHRAPLASLWLGARLGALFPLGSAYTVGYDAFGYQYGESWKGLASGGPSVEVDVGGRFARRYIVYGFWEHAWMGKGDDPSWSTTAHFVGGTGFGEQSSASTDYPGVGFRWSSRPDSTGFLVDLGLGYRWFRESWASGASMTLQGFGEFRAGFGADIRVNRMFSLSPLLMFSSGEFVDRQFVVAGQPSRSIPSYAGSHGTVTLTIGGHFDLAPSY